MTRQQNEKAFLATKDIVKRLQEAGYDAKIVKYGNVSFKDTKNLNLNYSPIHKSPPFSLPFQAEDTCLTSEQDIDSDQVGIEAYNHAYFIWKDDDEPDYFWLWGALEQFVMHKDED